MNNPINFICNHSLIILSLYNVINDLVLLINGTNNQNIYILIITISLYISSLDYNG